MDFDNKIQEILSEVISTNPILYSMTDADDKNWIITSANFKEVNDIMLKATGKVESPKIKKPSAKELKSINSVEDVKKYYKVKEHKMKFNERLESILNEFSITEDEPVKGGIYLSKIHQPAGILVIKDFKPKDRFGKSDYLVDVARFGMSDEGTGNPLYKKVEDNKLWFSQINAGIYGTIKNVNVKNFEDKDINKKEVK